jgi:hypothetical protein
MALAFAISVAAANAALDALLAKLNVGGTGGTIKVYTGSIPATVATAPTGTLLATLTFSVTAFAAAASGVATANTITSDTDIDATGTAGYFRCNDSAGTAVLQGTCGINTGSFDMMMANPNLTIHGVLACTLFQVTQPLA